MTLVNNNVNDGNVMATIVEDLRRRNPKFKSYYTRTWKDAKGWTWFDIGSHFEFYVMKEE